jgi:hypothetical protein
VLALQEEGTVCMGMLHVKVLLDLDASCKWLTAQQVIVLVGWRMPAKSAEE